MILPSKNSKTHIVLSVIIPAYNEELAIARTIESVIAKLEGIACEIIVVNDGSTDRTCEILKKYNVGVLTNTMNKGYGASIKSALRKALGDYVLTIDADGQHDNVDIVQFFNEIKNNNYDMVVGEREKKSDASFMRFIGKKFIRSIVNTLAHAKIVDFNSGLRIFKKDVALKYMHLYPNGFSLSTTMTIAFFKEGFRVHYIPITVEKRKGKSAVSICDAFVTILGVFRLIMIFSPLSIFLPLACFTFTVGCTSLVLDILNTNIQDSTVLVLLFSFLTFYFGLVVDQIAHIRREINTH